MIKEKLRLSVLLLLTLFVLFSIAIYLLPLFILGNASWTFVLSWLPIHAKWLIASFYIFMLMIMIWLSVVILTRQPKHRLHFIASKQRFLTFRTIAHSKVRILLLLGCAILLLILCI